MRHRPYSMLCLSFWLSFAFATVWVIVMYLTESISSGSFRRGPFTTPMPCAGLVILAAILAPVAFPLLYFALRERQLPIAVAILSAPVVLAIAALTPVDTGLGCGGSVVGYGMGLVLAHYLAPLHVEAGNCRRCGYDLRGIDASNGCPECGAQPT
jgi:hypothetical protein